jgi:hypothetical protein
MALRARQPRPPGPAREVPFVGRHRAARRRLEPQLGFVKERRSSRRQHARIAYMSDSKTPVDEIVGLECDEGRPPPGGYAARGRLSSHSIPEPSDVCAPTVPLSWERERARLQVVVSSMELNDGPAVRRQIVGHAVSGPGHGSSRFPIAKQHSGAERSADTCSPSRAAATWAMDSMPVSRDCAELVLARIAPIRRAISAEPAALALRDKNLSISLHERVTARHAPESVRARTQQKRPARRHSPPRLRAIHNPSFAAQAPKLVTQTNDWMFANPSGTREGPALAVATFRACGCRAPC